ncbi:hypothetical protein LJR030_005060 [Rhizobium sp. LjRoot30]|uniref:site-2 protease family protein n=1 Tax=Rhizobium sp. LjRoot30 TaxID=3342320 RepID=UPI003ED119B1
MIALWIVFAGFVATAIFVSATALAGRAFGLRPQTISCGAGPAPVTIRLGGCDFRLGIIVLAGSVRFAEDERSVESLAVWQQVLLHLSGVGALLLAAILLAGVDELHLAWRAATTLVTFSLSPLDHDALFRDALAVYAALPVSGKFAAIFAVFAGVNLLPIAVFPAGGIVIAVADRLAGLPRDDGVVRIYLLASLAYMIWILLLLLAQAWRLVQQSGLI